MSIAKEVVTNRLAKIPKAKSSRQRSSQSTLTNAQGQPVQENDAYSTSAKRMRISTSREEPLNIPNYGLTRRPYSDSQPSSMIRKPSQQPSQRPMHQPVTQDNDQFASNLRHRADYPRPPDLMELSGSSNGQLAAPLVTVARQFDSTCPIISTVLTSQSLPPSTEPNLSAQREKWEDTKWDNQQHGESVTFHIQNI
jgi:hypothetical protein